MWVITMSSRHLYTDSLCDSSLFCIANLLLLLNPETSSVSSSQAVVGDFNPLFRIKCPIPNCLLENTDYKMLTLFAVRFAVWHVYFLKNVGHLALI